MGIFSLTRVSVSRVSGPAVQEIHYIARGFGCRDLGEHVALLQDGASLPAPANEGAPRGSVPPSDNDS